jgi:hypothetical protein
MAIQTQEQMKHGHLKKYTAVARATTSTGKSQAWHCCHGQCCRHEAAPVLWWPAPVTASEEAAAVAA